MVPGGQLCGFEGPAEGLGLATFRWLIARGSHLFPFRTEQLSPSAPMVLGSKGPGRVGRRRFLERIDGPPIGRPVLLLTSATVSVLATILIVLAVIFALLFVGGLLGARRRDEQNAPVYARNLAEADHALEQARAADRGWDREVMEDVARAALAREHPETNFERLDLVLVDDRPGVDQDRAHFEASDGGRQVTVVLGRNESGWAAERVG